MVLPAIKIAETIKAKAKAKSVYQENKKDKTTRNVAIGLVLAVGAFFVGRVIVRKVRKNKTEKDAVNNPPIQQALLLRSAMNPSGVKWLMSSDGTKEKSLLQTAKQIEDFNKVADAYKNLYNRSLISDLQKELGTDDYAELMNILNTKEGHNNNSYAVTYIDKHKMIFTNVDTKLYGTVNRVGFPFYGISVDAGTILRAVTTGKEMKLSLFSSSMTPETTVIELFLKTKEGVQRTAYIHKDDVTLFPQEEVQEYMKTKKIRGFFSESDF
jgi:hypothetical protein